MKRLTYYLISILFTFFLKTGYSQVPDPPVAERPLAPVSVIAKSFGDSIVLRFAPTTIEGWKYGNTYGYNIYRYLIVEDRTNVVDSLIRITLTKNPLKPLNVQEIERLYVNDTYAGVVAQAIYGSSFNLDSETENTNLVNMANEQNNRYSFALFACDVSVNAAISHGLIYTDKDVKYGNKYLYCINPVRKDTFCIEDSVTVLVAVNDTFTTPVPANVYAGFEDKSVTISWEGEAMEQVFSAYLIERSDDGGKTFHKINDLPVINVSAFEDKKLRRMMYVDTIAVNEKEYFYRVRGITPFGEISKPSDVVSGQGTTFLVGVNPMITGSEVTPEFKLKVNWEFPPEHEKDIKGFIIERSNKDDGIYKQISDTLEVNERSFTDENASNVNYYQVCAISSSQYTYCSFPSLAQIADSVPPAVPTGLSGVIDSSGIVRIEWNKNSEADLMSYKIYRSNFPEGDFIQLNTKMIYDTAFTDTVPLNNLSNNIFYAVTAQDNNYNESEKCTPLKISKPDTIPPVPPVIKKFEVTENSIILHFSPSTSRDVIKNVLYRRQQGEKEWKIIELPDSEANKGIVTDSLVTGGSTFDYMMLAVDESGLESISNNVVTVKAYSFSNEFIVPLKLKPGADGKSVQISWEKGNPAIQKILIFKSTGEGSLVLFRTLDPGDETYTDTEVKIGTTYHYRSQSISTKGIRSKISGTYSINL